MKRHAWIDSDGVLIGHGFSDMHMDSVCYEVHEDFNLQPLQWRTLDNGITWTPYKAPTLSQTIIKAKRWFAFWRK